jgi:hypothetical protein
MSIVKYGEEIGEPEDRVARGIKFLNATIPDWHNKIELRDFNFWEPCNCVVGLVFRDQKTSDRSAWDLGILEVLKDLFGHEVPLSNYENNTWTQEELDILEGVYADVTNENVMIYLGFDWRTDNGNSEADATRLSNLWRAEIERRQGAKP